MNAVTWHARSPLVIRGRQIAIAGSAAGVELQFDGDDGAGRVTLDPDTAAALRDALEQQLSCRAPGPGRLGFSPALPASDRQLAGQLLALVDSLPTVGFERSVKLHAGQCDADRFLVAIDPHRWRAQATEAGIDHLLGQALHMPAVVRQSYQHALGQAAMTALSFEPGGVFKAYLDLGTQAGELNFVGYKWQARADAAARVTHYHRRPPAALDELRGRVRAALPGSGPLAEVVSRWLDDAAARAEPARWTWLDVDEGSGDAARASFDLNLYPAELRLRDCAPHWQAALAVLGCDGAAARWFFDATADGIVGHLSAGLGRDGRPFLTVYVEPPVA